MSVAFRVDQVEYPFPAKPQPLSEARKAELKAEIKAWWLRGRLIGNGAFR